MKTLLYITVILLLASCTQPQKPYKKDIKLKVAVNPDFRQYLDYPSIPDEYNDSVYYDSVHKLTISVYDSLANRKTSVNIFSMLTDDFYSSIYLQKDTMIVFDTTRYSNFIMGDTKDLMSLATTSFDTIYIGQKMAGCFGGYIEKTILIKKDKAVKIIYKCSNKPALDFETIISDSLFNKHFNSFIEKNKKVPTARSSRAITLILSTNRIDTYIRNGNIVYESVKGYDTFKKNIGIKTVADL